MRQVSSNETASRTFKHPANATDGLHDDTGRWFRRRCLSLQGSNIGVELRLILHGYLVCYGLDLLYEVLEVSEVNRQLPFLRNV
jgi:hypothetical protein